MISHVTLAEGGLGPNNWNSDHPQVVLRGGRGA